MNQAEPFGVHEAVPTEPATTLGRPWLVLLVLNASILGFVLGLYFTIQEITENQNPELFIPAYPGLITFIALLIYALQRLRRSHYPVPELIFPAALMLLPAFIAAGVILLVLFLLTLALFFVSDSSALVGILIGMAYSVLIALLLWNNNNHDSLPARFIGRPLLVLGFIACVVVSLIMWAFLSWLIMTYKGPSFFGIIEMYMILAGVVGLVTGVLAIVTYKKLKSEES